MSSSAGRSYVRLDAAEGVAQLILDRPDKRNALCTPLVEDLLQSLARVGSDRKIRVVALQGAGSDFCAGADLAEVAASQHSGPETGLEQARALGEVFTRIRQLPQPVVAIVQGRALGGGCGLAVACDMVLAHEEATFGFPEVHLGFVPSLVMTLLKRKVRGAAAFELVVRGQRIAAAEAATLGLVTRTFAEGCFEPSVRAYLAELAARPANAVALTKRLFHGLDGAAFEEAMDRGAEVNAIARLTEECRDGVRRFLEKT